MSDEESPLASDLFRGGHANRRRKRRQYQSRRSTTKPPPSLDRERIGSSYVHNPNQEIPSSPSVSSGRSPPISPPSSPPASPGGPPKQETSDDKSRDTSTHIKEVKPQLLSNGTHKKERRKGLSLQGVKRHKGEEESKPSTSDVETEERMVFSRLPVISEDQVIFFPLVFVLCLCLFMCLLFYL